MRFLKNHFSMYTHLPKEIYVLAFGKIMTSMGALIWPMLTLIMSEKLNLNGQTIGMYMMMFSLCLWDHFTYWAASWLINTIRNILLLPLT